MDNKKIIMEVLGRFYDVNLSSESAREWVANEIAQKIEDSEYSVKSPGYERKDVDSNTKGVFEQHMSNLDSINDEISENMKNQIKSKQDNAVKAVKKPKKVVKPTKKNKTLKGITKPGSKFIQWKM